VLITAKFYNVSSRSEFSLGRREIHCSWNFWWCRTRWKRRERNFVWTIFRLKYASSRADEPNMDRGFSADE